MTKPKFYTIGYSGRTPEEVASVLTSLGAVLADVRFRPFSQWQPAWNKKSLENLLGPLYVGLTEWGNRNYKSGPIEIADYEGGKTVLLAKGKPAVLMCACKDAAKCHRTVLAEMLRADGYEVEEVGQGAVTPAAPKKKPKVEQKRLF